MCVSRFTDFIFILYIFTLLFQLYMTIYMNRKKGRANEDTGGSYTRNENWKTTYSLIKFEIYPHLR